MNEIFAFLIYCEGQGHYLMLPNIKSRSNAGASLSTKFMKTDGMCLQFFYSFLGESGASINVNLVREDAAMLQLGQVRKINRLSSSTHGESEHVPVNMLQSLVWRFSYKSIVCI